MSGGKGTIPTAEAGELGISGLRDHVLIGQGGFGVVYRAEQPALGRTVAVKILSAPGLDDRTRERFERECVAIGALSGHPYIVTIYDSGINAWGRPFIVMDFMARGSIADRIALDGPLPWTDAADIGIKVCGAIASAHAVGILHRDIKPQNILVSAYGEPKLGDFGISSIGGDHTNSGTVTASLEHAAPELLEGSAATTSSDLYALASTIFTTLSGAAPFARRADEPIQSLIARIVSEPVPDLRPRGVPGPLCDALERALAKDPAQRYASVEEFATALRDVQEKLGVTPSPFVDAAPAGAFELIDRFTATRGPTTAPTRARARPEFVAPSPPAEPTPLWKRPLVAAVATLVILALAAGAFAVTRGNAPPQRDEQPAAIADVQEDGDDGTDDDARRNNDRRREQRNDNGKNKQRRFSAGAGSGGALPPPLPPSSGSSSDTSAPGSGSTTKQQPKKSSGGTAKEEKEPWHPPAPQTWLYHVWKDKQHFATIYPEQYPTGDGWGRQPQGLVYNYKENNTTQIATPDGPVWIFTDRIGETDPDVNRTTLWKMTKNGQYFYLTNSGARDNYAYNYQWESDPVGYAGEPR